MIEASSLPVKDRRGYGPLSEWVAAAHGHVVSAWAHARPSSSRHLNHTQRLARRQSGRQARPGAEEGCPTPRTRLMDAVERDGIRWQARRAGKAHLTSGARVLKARTVRT